VAIVPNSKFLVFHRLVIEHGTNTVLKHFYIMGHSLGHNDKVGNGL